MVGRPDGNTAAFMSDHPRGGAGGHAGPDLPRGRCSTRHTWRLLELAGVLEPTPPPRGALAPARCDLPSPATAATMCHLCTQSGTLSQQPANTLGWKSDYRALGPPCNNKSLSDIISANGWKCETARSCTPLLRVPRAAASSPSKKANNWFIATGQQRASTTRGFNESETSHVLLNRRKNPLKAPKSQQIFHPHKPHLTPPCWRASSL